MSRKKDTTIEDLMLRLFPAEKLQRMARESGAQKRRRKIDIVAFFWTLLLGFGIGKKRSIAELRRTYENRTGTAIEESSFYDRFTPGLVKWLKMILGDVIIHIGEGSQRLKGRLEGYRDLLLIDSTVIRLHDLLKGAFAGCRTNHSKAAAKLHVVMSVKKASATQVQLTPERTNDRRPYKRIGKWVKDRLLLFDLGYFSYELFTRIDERGGFFISRLKTNANPLVISKNLTWRGNSRSVVGKSLQEALIGLKRDVLDVMVEVTFKRRKYRGRRRQDKRVFRVVAVRNKQAQTYHMFITNIPPEALDGKEIAETYRLRWQVELLFKELKTHYRLDQLPSSKRPVVEALVYTAILTLIASHVLLNALRQRLDPGRTIPPLRWAAVFENLAPFLLMSILARLRPSYGHNGHSPWQLLLSQAIDPNLTRPYALGGNVA